VERWSAWRLTLVIWCCGCALQVVQGKPLEAFKDSSNNLGLNMYFLQVHTHTQPGILIDMGVMMRGVEGTERS
jgi:hypothetical protein